MWAWNWSPMDGAFFKAGIWHGSTDVFLLCAIVRCYPHVANETYELGVSKLGWKIQNDSITFTKKHEISNSNQLFPTICVLFLKLERFDCQVRSDCPRCHWRDPSQAGGSHYGTQWCWKDDLHERLVWPSLLWDRDVQNVAVKLGEQMWNTLFGRKVKGVFIQHVWKEWKEWSEFHLHRLLEVRKQMQAENFSINYNLFHASNNNCPLDITRLHMSLFNVWVL